MELVEDGTWATAANYSLMTNELRRGECSLHDGRIKHGAEANRSSRRRLGYTMRYLPAEVKVIPEKNVGHRLWLARGRPVAAKEYQNL